MKKFISFCGLGLMLLMLNRCGSNSAEGGSEFGNPSRLLKGTVVAGTSSSLQKGVMKAANSFSCPADTVIATGSLAQTTTASISADCSFSLPLTVATAYSVSFTLGESPSGDSFVATLIVRSSSSSLSSNVFVISTSASDMDLGTITIIDNEANPEIEPVSENDQDGDGINDFNDTDDDGDGILDNSEGDCDLDGYNDDYDQSDACDSGNGNDSNTSEITEVSPQNGDDFVSLDSEIDALFDCEIDEASVTADSFLIESDSEVIACTYTFFESDSVVLCDHSDHDFLPSTVYTATVDGVVCADGSAVTAQSWSWTTEESAP